MPALVISPADIPDCPIVGTSDVEASSLEKFNRSEQDCTNPQDVYMTVDCCLRES